MGDELIPSWYRDTTPRERLRISLKTGCIGSSVIMAALALLILFNPNAPPQRSLKDALEAGVLLLCFGLPTFSLGVMGTYVQYTYQQGLVGWLRRQQDKNRSADNKPEQGG